jgi:hypothetical protein
MTFFYSSSNNNRSHLHGLEQAIYTVEQVCGGRGEQIREPHGDEQLIDMWNSFFGYNQDWFSYDQ